MAPLVAIGGLVLRKRLLMGVAIALGIVFLSPHAEAGGVRLTPAFQTIELRAEQGSVEHSVTIDNQEVYPVTYRLSVIDMGALDETGGIIFSGLSADYQQKYGAAQWVQLGQNNVTVAGQSSVTIPYYIVNDDSLGPGGHYGAIIIQPDSGVEAANNQVVISPRAASLLFIRKMGGEVIAQSLEPLSARRFFTKVPSSLSLKFINEGNVHFVPRGVVSLFRGDNQVARGVINPESSLILPEKSRWYAVRQQFFERWQLPGRYTLQVAYRYDGKSEYQYASVTYIVYNIPLVLLFIAGLISFTLLLTLIIKRFKSPLQRWAARISRLLERTAIGRIIILKSATLLKRLVPKPKPLPKKPFVLWPTRDSRRAPRRTRSPKK